MAQQSRHKKKKPLLFSPGIREWGRAFLVALLVLILLRFFVWDFKSISDSSMEKTLLPGDILLVNKFNYGARMPLRILPQSWVNLFFSTDSLPPDRHLPYWRFFGNRPPDYNDLVYLNIPAPHQLPIDKRSTTVKRLVALPGDEIQMKNATLYVNGKPHSAFSGIQWSYLIETRRGADIDDFLARYNIEEGTRIKGRNKYVIPFTAKMADSVAATGVLRRIERFAPGNEKDFANPFGSNTRDWTPDNFGPVTLPYKGYSVAMNAVSFDKWRYHLIFHERKMVNLINDSVFIDGSYADNYTFRNDYYFFLGDNRHNTSDSRLWGLVPENHIKGRASAIFLSFNKNASFYRKLRWERIFRGSGVFNRQELRYEE